MVSVAKSSLFSSSNVEKNNASVAASLARLASGKRLTKAADDISALVVGTALNTQVTSLRAALGNTTQASSLLQVANGGLNQQLDILQRQKELATQASSGQLNDSGRAALNQEFQALSDQLDQLAGSTNFNGVALLNGAAMSFDVGAGSDPIDVSLASTTTTALFNGQSLGIATQSDAQAGMAALDQAIATITSAQASVGALQSRFDTTGAALASAIEAQDAAASDMLHTDIAEESTRLAASKLLQQASIATQTQTNKLSRNLLRLME